MPEDTQIGNVGQDTLAGQQNNTGGNPLTGDQQVSPQDEAAVEELIEEIAEDAAEGEGDPNAQDAAEEMEDDSEDDDDDDDDD